MPDTCRSVEAWWSQQDRRSLPGASLIEQGLADNLLGKESPEALLIAIGASRLQYLGVPEIKHPELPTEPELRLYRLLCASQGRGAYATYGSLVRTLVSFEQALELQRGRELRSSR